jgi:rhamnosyltransferase subunit B
MRVLITTAGSHGDINPFIAIGRALIARGHEAVMLANPYFQTQAEEAGLGYIPFGETFDLRDLKDMPDVMHPRRAASVVIEEMLLPVADDTLRQLPSLLKEVRPDAVLHHHISMATPWVCEPLGVPCANAVLAPMMWMAAEDVFSPMSWSPLHPKPWLRWAMRKLMLPAMRFQIDPPVNRLRREHGLQPIRDVWRTISRSGALNLGMWSPTFRGPLAGDPEGGVICGFPWHDRHGAQEEAPDTVENFLADGPEPILFSLGTAAVHVASGFYHEAAEACRILGKRGMLLVGNSGVGVEGAPAGVEHFTYVPFSRVMPRVAVSVHHGGIGTTAQGMRAGRPTVIVPHAHDQYDNAARVKRLGISETLNKGKLTARRLADAINRVLEDPDVSHKAAEVGRLVAQEDGAGVAAREIEKLVGITGTLPGAAAMEPGAAASRH